MSGSNLSKGFWCGQNIFNNINKLKNSNKKVKKLQDKLMRYKRKKAKQKKNKTCTYMPKSIECAHRKYEKVVYTHKK